MPLGSTMTDGDYCTQFIFFCFFSIKKTAAANEYSEVAHTYGWVTHSHARSAQAHLILKLEFTKEINSMAVYSIAIFCRNGSLIHKIHERITEAFHLDRLMCS